MLRPPPRSTLFPTRRSSDLPDLPDEGISDAHTPELPGLRVIDHDLISPGRSEEHTSELQSHSDLVCRLLLEKKNTLAAPSPKSEPRNRAIASTPRTAHPARR